MPANQPLKPFSITSDEIAHINQYRKAKDTSVLTVMFTDIKGFTRLTEEKGEKYSGQIRQAHDQLLVPIIEEGGGGLVVKHIGDAVMAVFSEPSTAVSRALKIQAVLRQYNAEHSGVEEIQVRIGLDMGQVTVENEISPDMFGRHVNRASRVEGLADGEQVFLTYPVFDSAKGWLASHGSEKVTWKLHGQYYLKGIPAPIEIYEVYDQSWRKPRPPAKGRKKRALPAIWVSAALLVLGAGLTLGVLQFQKTSVYFSNLRADQVMVDGRDKIMLEGDPSLELRKTVTKIKPGRHVLHYDINWQVKYFSEIEVKRGKNYLEPKFRECRLPSVSRHYTLHADDHYVNQVEVDRTFDYYLYDQAQTKVEHQANIQLQQQGKPNKTGDALLFDLSWKVTLDGKIISQEKITVSQPLSEVHKSLSQLNSHRDRIVIYEDADHYFYAKYYVLGASAELDIGAAYIEYKDK